MITSTLRVHDFKKESRLSRTPLLSKSILIGLLVLLNNRTIGDPKIYRERKAIIPMRFLSGGYGWSGKLEKFFAWAVMGGPGINGLKKAMNLTNQTIDLLVLQLLNNIRGCLPHSCVIFTLWLCLISLVHIESSIVMWPGKRKRTLMLYCLMKKPLLSV